MTRPREQVHSCLCSTARTGDIDSLIVSVIVFPLGCDVHNCRNCFCLFNAIICGDTIKLGAEEVTLFWMDNLLVAHCLCCSSPLPTYLDQVQVEQAQVLPIGLFRRGGGAGRLPGGAGRLPGGGASTQSLMELIG